jgi:DNA-binding NarL/FixJ family response regulator
MAALRAGARGYVPKRCAPEELRAAVRAAAGGILAVHPDVLPALQPREPEPEPEVERPRTEQPHPATRDALTPRDLEYLRYLAEGYTNKEIARAMVLAEDTVKKGIQTLIAKLGAVDRTHAVVLALRGDLIE